MSIYDVLKDIEREIYSKVKFLINSFDLKEANLEQFIFDLFSIVIENEHSRNLLLHTPYSKIITSSLEKALIEGVEKKLLVYEEMKSSTLKYTIAYHVFGSVRLFYSWIKSTQSADLSGFAKFLSSLVITGTKGLYGN